MSKKLIQFIYKDNNLKIDEWVEPFVGGCNVIENVPCKNRIGNDLNKYLIALYKKTQEIGYRDLIFHIESLKIDSEKYRDIRKNKENYEDFVVGFVGIIFSFNGIFFGSDVSSKTNYLEKDGKVRNFYTEGINSYTRTARKICNIVFKNQNYFDLDISKNALIYCDPPYQKTLGYSTGEFDSDKFFEWAREKTKTNRVYISEYEAPQDFVCVFKYYKNNLMNNTEVEGVVEKVFVHESQIKGK